MGSVPGRKNIKDIAKCCIAYSMTTLCACRTRALRRHGQRLTRYHCDYF